MARALEGITVLDFSHVVAGPLATHFLALNGACVIKVEQPRGDSLRYYTADPAQSGQAPAFQGINVDKKSITLDLKSAHGRAQAHALARKADIIVENFRPGIMAKFDLDAKSLRETNPDLIYCSISGYGQFGKLRDLPAIDQIIQSVAGLMLLSGHEDDPAQRIGFPIVDTYAGLLAAFAIETALLHRERNGGGQTIDLAMLDASLVMIASVINPYLTNQQRPPRLGNRGFSRAPTADTFRTAKGEITIGAVDQNQVEKLMQVLNLSHLLENEEYANRQSRIANADALSAEIARAFLDRPAKEWEKDLNAVNVPAARVGTFDQAIAMPHLSQRELVFDVSGPDGASYRTLGAGFKFETNGPRAEKAAPKLGEHNDEILANLIAESEKD